MTSEIEVIDASVHLGTNAKALRAAGVKTVFRYYTRDWAANAEKRLHPEEAQQLLLAGLRPGAVYEGFYGNVVKGFDRDMGLKDATSARTYANHVIGQPAGSAIYFGADHDFTDKELESRVLPYFESVKSALMEENGEPHYRIGAYGSGATCIALLERKLVDLTWVAQSTRWRLSKEFASSGRANMIQKLKTHLDGRECDPNEVPTGRDIGDFVVQAPRRPIHLLSTSLDRPLALSGRERSDRECIAKLIELGSTEAGLAAAREEASSLLPGYSHNGCAAHLYALLHDAGIAVKFSPYAGKMASYLEERGWQRVDVGNQQSGDVGVTFDRKAPKGADHVYLVLQILSNNEMLIADNQNATGDAPHRRFATEGHGVTPTEYFLRA